MASIRRWFTASLLVAVLAGCTSGTASPTPGATPAAPPTAGAATPTPTPTPTPTLTPTPTPTPAPTAPLAPTAVGMTPVDVTCPAGMDPCNSYKVTWTQPNPAGVTVKIYAVRDCLNPLVPPATTRVCVTPGTVIPNASLVLLGSVAAATGTFTFSLHGGATEGYGWFDDGHYAYAVVVEAVNAVGSSPWVIAASASKCQGCSV